MSEQAKIVLGVVVVLAIAGAFWLLLLSPKRQKADELSKQITGIAAEVESEQQRADAALAAKREFPQDYSRLVLLGKAVPADASTPSLLVQLSGLSRDADTSFRGISLGSGGEGGGATESATEVTATTLPPLGAGAGPSGFLAMPYSLEFEGGFFDIAGFIRKLDSMVETKKDEVEVKGRLVTIDAFSLAPVAAEATSGKAAPSTLAAQFSVNTYVTPPGQGVTAGATAAGPETSPSQP